MSLKSNKELLESLVYEKVDYTPVTSAGDLERFLEGSIYRDFLEEMKVRIKDMQNVYEGAGSKLYLETKGALEAMRLVAGIFEDLHNNSLNDRSK